MISDQLFVNGKKFFQEIFLYVCFQQIDNVKNCIFTLILLEEQLLLQFLFLSQYLKNLLINTQLFRVFLINYFLIHSNLLPNQIKIHSNANWAKNFVLYFDFFLIYLNFNLLKEFIATFLRPFARKCVFYLDLLYLGVPRSIPDSSSLLRQIYNITTCEISQSGERVHRKVFSHCKPM